jgi:hypothetical protein
MLLEQLRRHEVHAMLVALVLSMSVLVDLKAHDDAVAEHDAIHSGELLCGLRRVELHDEFPLMDVERNGFI